MRAAAIFVAGCAISLAVCFAVPAAADNGPHMKGQGLTPDTCAICHRAHTAQAPHLLREPETELCDSCHGAAAAGASTDVVDGIGYSNTAHAGTPGALRGGGFKYALIDSASASGQQSGGSDPGGVVPALATGAPVTSTHLLDPSSETAWGAGPISAEVDYGTGISLNCGSCHDPHGNGMYRILRPIPTESAATTPVEIPEPAGMKGDESKHVYTTTNYWDVTDEYAPDLIANISAWCATCHTRYLSDTSYTASGDAVFTHRHLSNGTAQGSPSCIQCHVAHGSNASVQEAGAMEVHSPQAVPAPPGSRLLRIDDKGTCKMCHAE